MGEWLDIREAAELLGIGTSTLRRYVADGKVQAYRLPGRQLRFKREDLEALLELDSQEVRESFPTPWNHLAEKTEATRPG